MLRELGCDVVINRSEIGLGDDAPTHGPTRSSWASGSAAAIRAEVGEDPHVVFDYVGRATFGTSVFVVRRGGVVVTCGSSTGYQHQYDNRYLWMNLKRIIGSHVANLQEQWECNRLFGRGHILPVLSDGLPARRGRRGGAPGADEPAHRQGRRALPGPAGLDSGSPTRRPGPGSGSSGSPRGGVTALTHKPHHRCSPAPRTQDGRPWIPSFGIVATGSYLPKARSPTTEIAERCGITADGSSARRRS